MRPAKILPSLCFFSDMPGFLIDQTCPDVSVDLAVTGNPSRYERGRR